MTLCISFVFHMLEVLQPWTSCGNNLKHPCVIYTVTFAKLELLQQRKLSYCLCEGFIGYIMAISKMKAFQ
jgi:hypothetical protein